MKVSIITVTYNSEKYIHTCINSVLNQTYKNIEYIIIDGNSTDSTIAIIDKYKSNISHLVSENDLGIYDAMNKGISIATGDIIGILNSDDVFQDNCVLSDVVSFFKEDVNLHILYGNLVYVKKDDLNSEIRVWNSTKYYSNYFENGNVPPHPTLFLKSVVYKIAGRFDLDYKLASDYEFMLRIFKKFNFNSKYVNRRFVKMRLGGATNKNIYNIIIGNKEILSSWKKNNIKIPLKLIPLRIYKRLIQFI